MHPFKKQRVHARLIKFSTQLRKANLFLPLEVTVFQLFNIMRTMYFLKREAKMLRKGKRYLLAGAGEQFIDDGSDPREARRRHIGGESRAAGNDFLP